MAARDADLPPERFLIQVKDAFRASPGFGAMEIGHRTDLTSRIVSFAIDSYFANEK